jgi:hypothetical protein
MTKNQSSKQKYEKLSSTLREDLRHSGEISRSLKLDFMDLKEFYLNKDQKDRLSQMNWFKKTVFTAFWLFKILFLKLTPARRIILLLSFILLFLSRPIIINSGNENIPNWSLLGIVLILFILMLELKDKLLAKDELEAGRQVQNALLPKENPVVPGWQIWLYSQPANDVGGDLIDFLILSETRFSIALSDIAGKGLSAALLTAKLQSTLRALLPDYENLPELVTKLNEIFYRDGLPTSFASLIYSEISPSSGEIRLVNAGHMPPLIIKNNKIVELTKGQTALGIIPEEKYKEQNVRLNKNDLFLVYSDGVTEARNEAGDFFGENRLIALLQKSYENSAQDLGKKLLQAIKDYVGETHTTDDISLAIFKRVE